MITPTEMEKRKKLVETNNGTFNVSSFLSSDFPDYDSYNRFMNLYEEERKRQGINPSNAMTYELMRKALVLGGSARDKAIQLSTCSDVALDIVLRAYKPLLYSFFSEKNDSTTNEFVESILRNMQKLPANGSYNAKQFRQAINYTVYPDLMQAIKREGDFRWEAGSRQFFLLRSLDELKIMFNNDFTSPEHQLFSLNQAEEFKSVLYSAPKGADGMWSGSQIKHALEKAFKVGFETEARTISELYAKPQDEKYFILKNGTAALRYSYLPDSCWSEIRQYFIEEMRPSQNDHKSAEQAFQRFYTARTTKPTVDVSEVRSVHKDSVTSHTKISINYEEKSPFKNPGTSQLLYPGSFPMTDGTILRNFLILADRQLMSIVQNGTFLAWSGRRETLDLEFQKAIKTGPKTARQVREAVEKHFRQFGWNDFPTFAELVEAGRKRARIP